MKLTEALKKWLVDQQLVKADETDDEVFRKAATDAIVSGALSGSKLAELQTEPKAQEAKSILDTLGQIAEGVKANAAEIASMKAAPAPAPAAEPAPANFKGVQGTVDAKDLVGEEKAAKPAIEVLGVEKQFDTTKSALRYPATLQNGAAHPKAGQIVTEGNRPVYEQSQLDKAIAGAWFKQMLQADTGGRNIPAHLRMNEQDQKLVEYAVNECAWGGETAGQEIKGTKLTPSQQKAVIDDATSGGLEIAPIVFDDAVITFPLLYGELYPKVNVQTITRGRRIEGASISNVTLTWGGGDGTDISLFATSGFVAAFDTNIFVVDGAIEIGLDFLSDAAVDIGPIVTDSYGRRLLTELDSVIADGNGTNRPEGIMQASGTTAVSSANGVGGEPTVGDYEGLLFGVPKEYKAGFANNMVCFCANETTYSRARGIAVGGSDARRVFGMTHEDYMLLSRPFAINGTLTNSEIFFGVMPRYRMYRRLGLTMRSSTEGKTLIRQNMLLMSARARFGGQIEDGAAFAVMTDAKA